MSMEARVPRENEKMYIVEGMTCDHCRAAVTQEVSAVRGVTGVAVDLPTGHMTVTGPNLDDVAITAAVVEAGYDVRL